MDLCCFQPRRASASRRHPPSLFMRLPGRTPPKATLKTRTTASIASPCFAIGKTRINCAAPVPRQSYAQSVKGRLPPGFEDGESLLRAPEVETDRPGPQGMGLPGQSSPRDVSRVNAAWSGSEPESRPRREQLRRASRASNAASDGPRCSRWAASSDCEGCCSRV